MKNIIDKINVQQVLTIVFLGSALLIAVWAAQENLAITIGSGLVGYLGGVTSGNVDKIEG